MTIATSITADYLERSQPYFQSVALHMPDARRICFTIGFTTTIEGWECVHVPFSEIVWRPMNREGYQSLQHGEFTKYANFDADEMILFTDSDMVLQRKWDIELPPTDSILVTYSSWPQTPLMEVVKNLAPVRRIDKVLKKWGILVQREFCTCFIGAKASTWERLYKVCTALYGVLDEFEHHAAQQLMINLAVHNYFKSHQVLPPFVVNGRRAQRLKASH